MTAREAVVRRTAAAAVLSRRAATRQLFLRRCALAALAVPDARVAVEVDPRAFIHPRVRVQVWPGTRSMIVIGPETHLGELTALSLRGGRLTIGANTDVRRLTTINLAGELAIGAGVVVSTGVSLHCATELRIDDMTIIGEWSTLADSVHDRTPPGVPVHHSATTTPVHVGTNCWLGARVTVAAGVTIGDQCVIGSGAVVTRDVPPGWLAAGVPARHLREL